MWRSLEWQKLHNSLHALKKKLLPVLVWIIWNLKMRLQTVIWRKTQLTVDSQPVSWTRDATELLISLYEEHEEELENPRNKKQDIWKKITAELNEAGYKYVQSKVEGKWRSLLASHKDLSLNKKRTGQKRKTFQYFEKIDNIIAKSHDINPPFTSESSKQKEIKFSTKVDKIISCTSSQTDEESSTVCPVLTFHLNDIP